MCLSVGMSPPPSGIQFPLRDPDKYPGLMSSRGLLGISRGFGDFQGIPGKFDFWGYFLYFLGFLMIKTYFGDFLGIFREFDIIEKFGSV